MSEKQKLSELVAGSTPSKDESIDVSALLNNAVENTESTIEEPVKETKLQKMQRERAQTGGGVVIDNKDYVPDGHVKKQDLQVEKDIDIKMEEMDSTIKTMQNLNIPKPSNPEELVKTMDVVEKIASGEKVDQAVLDELNITEKTEEQKAEINYAASPKEQTSQEEIPDGLKSTEDFNRDDVVQILIDKTGLGGNIKFTPEEESKLLRAKKIVVSEVEEKKLATAKFTPPQKSFTAMISEYEMDTVMTKVTFPASRFTASVGGLGFGELGDIALSNENITYEKLNKELTILYNKLKNASTGNFDNYDDFLSKLAYTDIDFGIFGLACSTFPEVDTITLQCQHPSCKQHFDHTYSPRTLIRFDKMYNKILNDIKITNSCQSLSEAKAVMKESPVQKYKIIELPFSKYLVEIGIASAKEYLDNLIGVITDEKWNETHPEDVNNLLQINSTFLTVIRAISVPMNGSYVRFSDVDDIIEAIYTIKPDEATILAEILDQYLAAYQPVFELVDIKCPHCGTVTKSIPIQLSTLVFLKFQALKNTKIELKGILDL